MKTLDYRLTNTDGIGVDSIIDHPTIFAGLPVSGDTYGIANTDDDGFEIAAYWFATGCTVGLLAVGYPYTGCVSFTGNTPPKDAVIRSASLDFYVATSPYVGIASAELFGDKGAGLSGATAQPSAYNMPYTHWYITPNRATTARVAGVNMDTIGEDSISGAGLVAIIQEIVSLSNWVAGNRINLAFRDTGYTVNYSSSISDSNPTLTLTWT